MSASVHDDRPCLLGEGALWHPLRRQFFWFDILGRRLMSKGDAGPLEWRLDRMASAAGWIDRDRLLVATETGLAVLDLTRGGALEDLAPVEAGDAATRSNDGRADRQGGFWFGTMGKRAEPGAGALYRWYRGQVRRLFQGIGIPNAISFAPDGRTAFFADTAVARVWRQPLDAQGWPQGPRQPYLDLAGQGLAPDGAVIDADGGFCCACWGEGAVIRFAPDGRQTHRFTVGGKHSTCPAFGPAGQMLVTTAREGIAAPDPAQGLTYLVAHDLRAIPEPAVLL
ncbi:SMP-30/gluconolactonase/LRE family protein [Paracoccus thiocyanatus]|uniref:Gluconolactonase n=1 Tax=Paracoccus thiocyanatus TaxID=34006 RepID=A0A3D8PBC5_9RHOB|nr:SMP-30/gluconolactonase/LRE family protein [Paracoccus thiocyanatus]RDW12581.1 gluconolactonase [Paracoccus thiocyanatus]